MNRANAKKLHYIERQNCYFEYSRKDSEGDFVTELGKAIVRFWAPPSGLKRFEDILNSKKYNGRHKGLAMLSLATLANEFSIPILKPFLKSKDWFVRNSAIAALGATGHESAALLLTSFLDGDDPWIKSAAICALRELGFSLTAPKIMETFEQCISVCKTKKHRQVMKKVLKRNHTRVFTAEEEFHDGVEHVADECTRALGKIGNPMAIPVLKKALRELGNSSASHHQLIVLALGELGDQSVVPEIRKMCNGGSRTCYSHRNGLACLLLRLGLAGSGTEGEKSKGRQ